jgi:hypothetical protein
VVQAAYVQAVSTRKVDDLVRALGLSGIEKSKVSRIRSELDGFVEAFRNRPLEGGFPYLWLDALYLKVRQGHRIVSQALVVAIAVRDHRRSGDPGPCARPERGIRLLAGLPPGAGAPRAHWRATGHQPRTGGAQGSHRSGTGWRQLAALPGALHAQRPGAHPQKQQGSSRRRLAHDLRPARPPGRWTAASRSGSGYARPSWPTWHFRRSTGHASTPPIRWGD